MAIRRAERPHTQYLLLSNSIAEDGRLSWAARGMLVYLLAKPDNWTVQTVDLQNATKQAGKHSGRDAVRAILEELIAVGYVRKWKSRQGDGQFNGWDYEVGEIPVPPTTDYPTSAEPTSAEPNAGEPSSADPSLSNNSVGTNTQRAVKTQPARGKAKGFDPLLLALPDWLQSEVWATWVKHRDEINDSLTEQAATLLIDRLAEFHQQGHCPKKLIDLAIVSGWKTIYPRDDTKVTLPASPDGKPGAALVGGKPWFLTWSGIEGKAKELNLRQGVNELAPDFKVRVFKASGLTREEYRKGEQDYGGK